MDWMKYVDVSSSILFEATADSEADSDINKNMDHALLREDMGLADDDALSCSCDDIDFKDFDQYSTADRESDLADEEDEGLGDDYKNFDDGDDDDDDDDVEEGVVDQLWNGDLKAKDLKPTGGAAPPGVLMDERQGKKLKVCADSVKEFVNRRDKDRLFWETCLAS